MLTTPKPTEILSTSSPGSLRLIPPLAVLHEWPRVASFVRRALERGEGSYLEADVALACMAGQWQLWVMGQDGEIKAVGVTEIVNFPRLRKCLIRYLSGDLETIMPHWAAFESWARERECHVLEIYGRKGWERVLPDWTKRHVIFTREL